MPENAILVINGGSSSLKFGLYTQSDADERPIVDGVAEGIGRASGKLELRDAQGRTMRSEGRNFASEAEALDEAAKWLAESSHGAPAAIGHRVVHGGPRLVTHQKITPALLAELEACVDFAPLHIPNAVKLIESAQRRYPGVPEFACFDTAFHRTMPEVAARLPLPGNLYDEGIRRYGFHGLSYESIVYQLGRELPARLVVAHLGNGASLAAIQNGKSVDTSMGLTPTGGIPMATRSGDLDPEVVLYLQRVKRMNAEVLEQLLVHQSGLTALSGGKSDMRDLESAADAGDQRARLAIAAFCTAISKVVAGYSTVLGGLDMLVFAGGIGEHSAHVRDGVCERLAFLGIALDAARNAAQQGAISAGESRIAVRIVPSQEDRQIARHCRRLLAGVSA
jgi:acetate kinase